MSKIAFISSSLIVAALCCCVFAGCDSPTSSQPTVETPSQPTAKTSSQPTVESPSQLPPKTHSQPTSTSQTKPFSAENTPADSVSDGDSTVHNRIRGFVQKPPNNQNLKITARINIYRNNEQLPMFGTLDEQGVFNIPHPGDRKPFVIYISPSDHCFPIVIHDVVSVGGELGFRWTPFSNVTSEEARRRINECRDVIPAEDKRMHEQLDQLERKSLEHRQRISLLIPAYFPPSHADWDRIFELNQRVKNHVELIVVLNILNGSGKYDPTLPPSSGSQTAKSPRDDYRVLTNKLKAADIPWVGYVTALDGNRRPRNFSIRDDFKHWFETYPDGMSGVFLADVPPGAAHAATFRSFCDYVRSTLGRAEVDNPLVIAHPGRGCDLELASLFDWICIDENPVNESSFELPPWSSCVDAKLGALLHSVNNSTQLQAAFDRLGIRQCDFLFFSHQNENTKWNELLSVNLLDHLERLAVEWNQQVGAGSGVGFF